jgi:hypothetical protein
MAERKFVRLWITVFVAIVALFASGEVRAASTCAPAGECVNLDGYQVTVDSTGGFPSLVGSDSVFNWKISGTAAAKANVNTIDIKIPADIDSSYENLRSHIVVSIFPATGPSCTLVPFTLKKPTGWALAPKGVGDLTTSIGRFEYDYYVLAVVPPKECPITKYTSNKIQLNFKGKSLKSGLNSFLVRASLLGEALNLLGPSLSGQSTSAGNQPIFRSVESFRLGDANCLMDIALNPDESIANASVHPFDIALPNACADAQLTIESISKTWICENNGSDQPVPDSCKPKTFVEQNIIDKSGNDSTYCYYTKTGSRVCKTL